MDAVDIISFNDKLKKAYDGQLLWHPNTTKRGFHWNVLFNGNINIMVQEIVNASKEYTKETGTPVELMHLMNRNNVIYYHIDLE